MNIDKLVETLNQTIQKAGGEASRVWPEMVAAHAMTATFVVAVSSLFGLIALTAAMAFLIKALRYQPPPDRFQRGMADGDYLGVMVIALIVAGFCSLPIGFNIASVFHPEAGLVRSLLGR